ncbi:MAG: TRAP transporter small permease subunit [Deltaproteobacteria bacterium]|nr:TRAP transporter small permease subunit [Deltaproteobacteria bacterium]
MLSKIENFLHRLCSWFEWVSVVAILLIMTITCVDVVGAKVFKSPVFGALDIVTLAQLIAISFAASMTLNLGRHVQVDFFFDILPKYARTVINIIILLLGLGLFIIIIWRLGMLGYSFQKTGEYSPTAYIPFYPFAYGVSFGTIPVFLVMLMDLVKSFKRREPK